MALTQVGRKPNTYFPKPQINNHFLSDAHYYKIQAAFVRVPTTLSKLTSPRQSQVQSPSPKSLKVRSKKGNTSQQLILSLRIGGVVMPLLGKHPEYIHK